MYLTTRSTTGCYTCKRRYDTIVLCAQICDVYAQERKKKCDETHPKCQRCFNSGIECAGYAPLDSPDDKGLMRRTKLGPDVIKSNTRSAQSKARAPGAPRQPRDGPGVSLPRPNMDKGNILDDRLDFSTLSGDGGFSDVLGNTLFPNESYEPFPDFFAYPSPPLLMTQLPTIQGIDQLCPSPPFYIDQSLLSSDSSSVASSSDLVRRPSTGSSVRSSGTPLFLTPNQYQLAIGLTRPADDLHDPGLSYSVETSPSSLYGPTWPAGSFTNEDDESDTEEDDPESVERLMCADLIPDANTPNNALPFVLQSYARWMNFTIFDPSKVVNLMRDVIIAQFSSSEESRTRIILLSNVVGSLSKSSLLDSRGLSLIALLRTEAHRSIDQFNAAKQSPEREKDMQNASKSLELMMDVLVIKRFSSPLKTVIGLMQAAAPVFRRACPEPPERLVNLSQILLGASPHLRHFAVTDVMISFTLARPLFFRYDVNYTPEICNQLMQGSCGMQWLYGIPDQFIIILAWISTLYEDYGSSVIPEQVAEIEREIDSVRITPGQSTDPILTVWRLAVQECWRQTVLIYLYVTLCGARADDPRVMKAVKSFVGLVDGVKAGRNPDSFLFFPIMFSGAFAYRKRDRDLIRKRMAGLQECTNPGTAGYECLTGLANVWARTDAERRPAEWSDMRIACYRVAGV
ncbi:Starch synthase [Ceratobasidium theobromae]|uniref:Starch synthase n=1 Tax=Ceratobasidium theobromae TaxID=1582974 RepID=A0A5N5QEP3_9AGAM|nr:Starch synthase [Ceratobasidium theobromae]